MRTLNKTLCLVLCIALCFTLVGSAFAYNTDTYTDAAKVGKDYFEAVDVMVGIGIINGTSATTLDPQGTYTREQAAKIITYMRLGEAAANNLKSTSDPFADVKATDWAAPYIQYCVENNIIAGAGDGNFYPKNVVSGYEMGKMVLCALGYGVNDEYEGSAWNINVAKDGIKLGIFGDNSTMQAALATGEKITREQAIYIGWEGLFEKTVTWSTLLDQYVTGNIFGAGNLDTTIGTTVYGTLAEVVFGVGKTTAILRSTQFSTDGTTAALLGTGDAKYADKTVEDITVVDAMDYAGAGYRYNVYFKTDSKYLTATKYTDVVDLAIRKGGLIGYYADAASADMTALPVVPGVTTAKTFNLYVAAAGLSFPSTEGATIDYVYNYNYDGDKSIALAKGEDAEDVATWFLKMYKSGAFNGYTLVDNNKDGIVDAVVVTDYSVEQVSSVSSTAYFFEGTPSSIKIANVKGDTLVADDVAMVVRMKDTNNYVVSKAATVKGAISSYDSISGTVNTITVGDKTYAQSNEIWYHTAGILADAPIIVNEGLALAPKNVGSEEQTFWLDPQGAVLGFTGSKSASGIYDLAYIVATATASDGFAEKCMAYILFADGTEGKYTVSKYNESNPEVTEWAGTVHRNEIANVTVTSTGKVEIKSLTNYNSKFSDVNKLYNRALGNIDIKNGNAYVGTWTDNTLYGTDKTVYFYVNGNDPYAAGYNSSVYVGYAKAASTVTTGVGINVVNAAYYNNITGTTTRKAAAIGAMVPDGWNDEGTDVYFWDGTTYTSKTVSGTKTIAYTLYKNGTAETYTVSTVGTVDPELRSGLTYDGTTYPPAGFYRKSAVTSTSKSGLTEVAGLWDCGLTNSLTDVQKQAIKAAGYGFLLDFGATANGYRTYQVLTSYTSNVLRSDSAIHNAIYSVIPAAYKTAFAAPASTYVLITSDTKVVDVRSARTDKYSDKDYLSDITSVKGIEQAQKEGYNVYYSIEYDTTTGNADAAATAPKAKTIYVTLAKKAAASAACDLESGINYNVYGAMVEMLAGITVINRSDLVLSAASVDAKVYIDGSLTDNTAVAGSKILVRAADGVTYNEYTVYAAITGALQDDTTAANLYKVNDKQTALRVVTGTTVGALATSIKGSNSDVLSVNVVDSTDFDKQTTETIAATDKVEVTFDNGTTKTYTVSTVAVGATALTTVTKSYNVATNAITYNSTKFASLTELDTFIKNNDAAKALISKTVVGTGKITVYFTDYTPATVYTCTAKAAPTLTSVKAAAKDGTITDTAITFTGAVGADTDALTIVTAPTSGTTLAGAGKVKTDATKIDMSAGFTAEGNTITVTETATGFETVYTVAFTVS